MIKKKSYYLVQEQVAQTEKIVTLIYLLNIILLLYQYLQPLV